MRNLVQSIRRWAASLATLAVAIHLHSASAATVKVTNTKDSGAGSLRQAVASAAAGDTITFAVSNGTIKLTSGQIVLSKDVTINGPGANSLALNGNKTDRIFSVPAGVTATISGMTLVNGAVTGSAAGGAIFCDSSTVTLDGCVLTGNSAPLGGAIALQFATVYATDTTLSYNQGTTSGGAVYVIQGSILFYSSSIYKNVGVNLGGGIYNNNGTVKLTNTTVACNTAKSGGAIASDLGTVFTWNSTVAVNAATVQTGGILNRQGATVLLNNTIVAANTAPLNPDLWGDDTSGQLSFGGSLIGNSTGSNITLLGTDDQLGTSAAPIDPKLDALDDYGGPTLSMALLPGSPAINKGVNSLAVDAQTGLALTSDQRGFPRVVGGRVDIGAYEYLAAKDYKNLALSLIPTTSTGDTKIDAYFSYAKCYIQDSLSSCYWADSSHLTCYGSTVFCDEAQAACWLMKIAACNGAWADRADQILEALVLADQTLAKTAIDEARACVSNKGKFQQALKNFDQAKTFAAKGRYTEAISTYGQAWKNAENARGWDWK